MMRRQIAVIAGAALLMVSCGGSDSSDESSGESASAVSASSEFSDDDGAEFVDALNDAMGAGGGGMLTWDGNEIVIDSVVCNEDANGNIEVSTVSDSGFRVLLSGSADDPSAQILDDTFSQWFDGSRFPDGVDVVLTKTSTGWDSSETTWWNNQNDDVINASFSITCP